MVGTTRNPKYLDSLLCLPPAISLCQSTLLKHINKFLDFKEVCSIIRGKIFVFLQQTAYFWIGRENYIIRFFGRQDYFMSSPLTIIYCILFALLLEKYHKQAYKSILQT